MGIPDPEPPKASKIVPFAGERLDSWKEIARYLNRDVRTVQRWEEAGGLPVHRRKPGRLKGSPVCAYKSELDVWVRQTPPPPVVKEAQPSPAVNAAWNRPWVLGIAGLVLILAAGGAIVWRSVRPGPAVPPLRVVRLTSYPGLERQPAFSPDGKQIAFSWDGEKQDNFDIYVKLLDSGEPLRLTTHPGVDGWPAWSPDGRLVAFWRWVRGASNIDVLTVPALGGAERQILQSRFPPQPGPNTPGLCWTPDGKWIITPYTPDPNTPVALVRASVETLEIQPVTRPVAGTSGDCCPAITPDGRRLAFIRASGGRAGNVYVLPLDQNYQPEGEPRQLSREFCGARNPMWTGDGRDVLYFTVCGGVRALWRVPQDASRPAAPVESLGLIGTGWAISPRGDRLMYSETQEDSRIWRADLPGGQPLSRVLASSAFDSNPEISPDGNRIAFLSNRARGTRIWVSRSDGANSIDLAGAAGRFPGPARWSPDSNQIVFECQNEGNDDVCVVPAGGGTVRRLTWHPARDTRPNWSHDGKWIYFTSNRSGSFQIWKAPADRNDAKAVQVTKGGGYCAVESPDGTSVFFARDPISPGIWKVSIRGGGEAPVGGFRIAGLAQNFAVARDGIYYASSSDPERWFELEFYRFATGKSEPIRRIEKRLGQGLSVAPDGRWLLFSANEGQNGDLYMVENFR